ncbi:unnamed protein product [Polarella glacialis]|uniref:Ceramide glucosyltransferase n=1 Tax=Polarella glacialis TaxID=89957 RepID=A0A813LJG5_POLGL|nr:unnamed protein product [Polarella glacialis]
MLGGEFMPPERRCGSWLKACPRASAAAAPKQAWAVRRRRRCAPAQCWKQPRQPLLIVGVTSLPSRLRGAGPALLSVAAQSRRPDRLVLSLPRRSQREGRAYQVPPELRTILSAHPWMEVHWIEEDFGPGTKLLGAIDWLAANVGQTSENDVLMVLDDDHAYLPHALGELLQQQLSLGSKHASSFFAYFFRGLMVPQGADIIALQLGGSFSEDVLAFHRDFVAGDDACFLVDDLWLGMFLRLSGRQVVSHRELVTQRGLEMIYQRTGNASAQGSEMIVAVVVVALVGVLVVVVGVVVGVVVVGVGVVIAAAVVGSEMIGTATTTTTKNKDDCNG